MLILQNNHLFNNQRVVYYAATSKRQNIINSHIFSRHFRDHRDLYFLRVYLLVKTVQYSKAVAGYYCHRIAVGWALVKQKYEKVGNKLIVWRSCLAIRCLCFTIAHTTALRLMTINSGNSLSFRPKYRRVKFYDHQQHGSQHAKCNVNLVIWE